MGTGQLLVIQGEEALRASLVKYLTGQGYQVEAAAEANTARALLAKRSFDVAITELQHPQDREDMEWVRHLHRAAPNTAILILTQGGTFDSALEAFRSGAHDYLLKPFPLEHLGQKVANILHFRRLVRSRSAPDEQRRGASPAPVLIGRSHAMAAVGRLVRKVAASPSTVLITGESGTGKELVARALHLALECPGAVLARQHGGRSRASAGKRPVRP